jgi:hypothetical protein
LPKYKDAVLAINNDAPTTLLTFDDCIKILSTGF